VSITVIVRNNNIEKAMRVLKKKVLKDGLLKEYRLKQYYMKPSEKRREKAKERTKVLRKIQKANDEFMGYCWVKGEKVKKI